MRALSKDTQKRATQYKREARQAAARRGHEMNSFLAVEPFSTPVVYHAFCKNCGAHAQVLPDPAPNQIDISGGAVATNCGNLEAAELRDLANWADILRRGDSSDKRLFRHMPIVPGKHDACGAEWHNHTRNGQCPN